MARSGAFRIALCLSLVGGALAVACTTDYQKGLEDPNFGGPNALADQTQPGPSSANAADGEGAGGAPDCVKAGGALVDGGACDVSFKDDILKAFGAASCQTAGCHGGTTPQNLPRIDPGDPASMWATFSSFKLSNGKSYVNPCSTELTESAIACSINNAQGAGCGTVMPQGVGLPTEVIAKVETWVKCGSPNN